MSEPNDVDYDLADAVEAALEAAGQDGLTPSAAARKTGTTTDAARGVLQWMASNRYAHTSGNGAWTRYHAGRE